MFLSRYKTFRKEYSKILFYDLDFNSFKISQNLDNGELVLYNPISDSIIDQSIYQIIVDYIRKVHNLQKNVERAMTETTREVLLDEAKEQYEMNKNKSFKSILLPLISTMTNMEGFKYNWDTVWDVKINAFMDSVKQLQHIKNADLLLSSGYSGFGIDLKKVNKREINYFYRSDES